jgi:hypothetical protein
MQQGQLNWADLNGLLAVLVGPLVGATASHGRGATWPFIVAFAAVGFAIGCFSAKFVGRAAYVCLHRAAGGVGSLLAYMLLALAMPITSAALSALLPVLVLHRGAA